jgi:hypothetical protein
VAVALDKLDDYAFVTEWTIPAPVDHVWRELTTPDDWPTWWRGVERVEMLRPGETSGIGAVRRYTWRSRLPYRLTFVMETTRIEPCTLIEGMASGELEGRGCWQLRAAGGHTAVRYDWQVKATKAWMRFAAPIAKPLFAWNHDVVMEWGRQGLVRRVVERA